MPTMTTEIKMSNRDKTKSKLATAGEPITWRGNYLIRWAIPAIFFLAMLMPSLVSAQGLLNAPTQNNVQAFEFTGANLGFQVFHESVKPLWLDYDRVVIVSTGVRFKKLIHVSGELGVPVFRYDNRPRNTYISMRVDLRLL